MVVVYWVFLKPSPPPTPTFAPKPVKFDAIKPRMGAGLGSGAGGSKAVKKEGQIGVKIFFGSQTGTAEDFSGTLADEASSYNFFPEVVDMEEYDEVRVYIIHGNISFSPCYCTITLLRCSRILTMTVPLQPRSSPQPQH